MAINRVSQAQSYRMMKTTHLSTKPRRIVSHGWMLVILITVLHTIMPNTSNAGTPSIVAHRGASHAAPENTLPSVLLAWEEHADATEVDIHLTKDNQVIVLHDKTTGRTAGTDLKVADVQYADLKKLDVGTWKSKSYKGTPIPLLKDILAHIPKSKRIFIEIKCPSDVLPHLEKVVRDSDLSAEQTVFIAFDWDTIRLTKERFPNCSCFWLSGFKKHKVTGRWEPSPDQVLQRALEAKVDGVDVHHGGPVDRQFVNSAKSKGLEVHVYTVNDPSDGKRMLEAGVDGITTDRPAFMKKALGLD